MSISVTDASFVRRFLSASVSGFRIKSSVNNAAGVSSNTKYFATSACLSANRISLLNKLLQLKCTVSPLTGTFFCRCNNVFTVFFLRTISVKHFVHNFSTNHLNVITTDAIPWTAAKPDDKLDSDELGQANGLCDSKQAIAFC